MRSNITFIAVWICVILGGGFTHAAKPDGGAKTAHEFWQALTHGNVKAMATLYAPKVTLKAGSELLKPRWAIDSKADRTKDLAIDRAELVAGYERLIGAAGQKRWSGLFGKIGAKQITAIAAKKKDMPFTGVHRGDRLLGFFKNSKRCHSEPRSRKQ